MLTLELDSVLGICITFIMSSSLPLAIDKLEVNPVIGLTAQFKFSCFSLYSCTYSKPLPQTTLFRFGIEQISTTLHIYLLREPLCQQLITC